MRRGRVLLAVLCAAALAFAYFATDLLVQSKCEAGVLDAAARGQVQRGLQPNRTNAVPYVSFRHATLRKAAMGYHIWSEKYKVGSANFISLSGACCDRQRNCPRKSPSVHQILA